MRSVIVKGEAHNHDSDLKEVLSLDFSQYDAVFVEDHAEPDSPSAKKPGLLLFFHSFTLLSKAISNTYHSYEKIENRCGDCDATYEEDIDLDAIETYQELWLGWKILIPSSVLIVSLIFGVGVGVLFPAVNVFGPITIQYIAGVIMFLIAFIVLENGVVEALGTYAREQKMANEILQRSIQNEYETVLVVCGELHRPMIAHRLRLAGWKVEQKPTNFWLKPIYSPLQKLRLWTLKHLRKPNVSGVK